MEGGGLGGCLSLVAGSKVWDRYNFGLSGWVWSLGSPLLMLVWVPLCAGFPFL